MATLLVLGSCARSPKPPVAAIAGAHPSEPRAEPQQDVQLLDPGAEPRRPLRYRIGAGATENLVVEVATELKLAIGDMSPPQVRSPTVRVSLEVSALSVSPALTLAGKIVKVEVPEDPTIPAPVAAAVRSDLERLAGTRWQAVFTDRGLVQRMALPAPADANPQLLTTLERIRDSLRLLLAPLPEAPVGGNARWQTRRRTIIGSVRVDETATFRLGAPTAGKRALAVIFALTSGEQNLAIPGLPPGATLTLTSFAGKGSGQLELDLERIVQPSSIGWSAAGRGSARPAGEPPTPMTLTIDSSVNIRRQ